MNDAWPLVRLGYLCRLQSGLTVDAARDLTGDVVTRPYLRVANVQAGHVETESVTEITVPRSLAARSTLQYGDVLMTEGGDLDKLGRGTVWRNELEGCLHQNHVFALRTFREHLDPQYLALVTQSLYARHYFETTGTKTTNLASTNKSKILDFPTPLPPLEEQRRIAGFLTAEIARINQATDARRSQLKLLKERRISQIHSALSGADVPGPRRISGLDWLGDIPAEWPVSSVSSQFQVQLGKMLNQERASGPNRKPYLRVLNVQWDKIDTSELIEMSFSETERSRYEVLPGDLLICEGGSYPGRAAVWDGRVPEIYYQKALHRARSHGRSSVRWLYYFLRLALSMGVFHAEGNSATITHLTSEQLASRRFPFPDPEVQLRITSELDAHARSEDLLREALTSQLSLLEERRQALITAAVTGQIDVTTARGV